MIFAKVSIVHKINFSKIVYSLKLRDICNMPKYNRIEKHRYIIQINLELLYSSSLLVLSNNSNTVDLHW